MINNEIAFDLINKLINDGDTLSIQKFDTLINQLESTNAYRSYNKGGKYITTMKN